MIDMGSPIYGGSDAGKIQSEHRVIVAISPCHFSSLFMCSGDVSAIFSNKYIADSTLLSPVDSGMYEMNCHSAELQNLPGGCSTVVSENLIVAALATSYQHMSVRH